MVTDIRKDASLASREVQIKITIRYYLIPVRMVTINKTGNNKGWRGCGENKTSLTDGECILVQPLRKTVLRFLKKLRIELPYDPATPQSSLEKHLCKDTCTSMFTAALLTVAKTRKQPKCFDK